MTTLYFNSIDQYQYYSQLWPWPLTTYIKNGVTSLWSNKWKILQRYTIVPCCMWELIWITIWMSFACYSPETIPFQTWQFRCEMRYKWRIGVKSLDSVVYGKAHRNNETNINRNIVVEAILFGFDQINLSIENFEFRLFFRMKNEQVVKSLSHCHI